MGDLPKGWVKCSLDQIVKYQKGKKPKVLNDIEISNTVPYLDIQAFTSKNIRQYADINSSNLASEDDLLMVWDGARSGLVGLAIRGAIGSTIVSLKPLLINKYYL